MNCVQRFILSVVKLTILATLAFPTLAAGNYTLTARVDRDQVTLYERITYTLTIESDSRNIPDPSLPDFNGFRTLGSPRTSSQFSWVNGRVQNSRTLSYLLEARTEGRYTLSPAKINADGKEFLSNPVVITVVKPGVQREPIKEDDQIVKQIAPQSMDNLFVELYIDNTEPYVAEPIRASLHVFTRLTIRDYGIQEEPEYQGFWTEPVDRPVQQQLTTRYINNVEYGEANIYEIVLYPTVSGELVIPPLIVAFQVQDRQRDPFDQFFNSPFQSSFFGFRTITRSSKTAVIKVRPLPNAGKPVDFNGAVGQFKLESSIKDKTVKVGEAIIITLTLSGNHGMKTIAPPKAPTLSDFKVFDPKSSDISPDPEIPGWQTRSFDYIFVPYQAGDYTIPGFSFSYFDADAEAYKTLMTDSFPVSVTSAPGGLYSSSTRVEGKEITLLNVDTRYIKTALPIVHYVDPYKRSWFFCCLAAPFLVVPLILAVSARKRRLEGDEIFAREVRARSVSEKRLSEAKKAWKNGDFHIALDATARAFSQYLADRMGLPRGGITLKRVEEILLNTCLEKAEINQISQYWNNLDAVRYSPVELSAGSVERVIEDGRKIIERLEKVKLKKKKSSAISVEVN
ncbi:MAG: BatD family protein [bacterium]